MRGCTEKPSKTGAKAFVAITPGPTRMPLANTRGGRCPISVLCIYWRLVCWVANMSHLTYLNRNRNPFCYLVILESPAVF